jgi:hypothetical protein
MGGPPIGAGSHAEGVDTTTRRSYHPDMPMWRCPHCETPQAEAARCWVCRRSSTSCGTCRHFRRAVAANLGYCGLDRARTPLAGDELRGCWTQAPVTADAESGGRSRPLPVHTPAATPRLDFVEVTPTSTRARRRTERDGPAATPVPSMEAPPATIPEPGRDEARWSLWGDLDR